jgi:hypothetical protein
MPHISSYPCRLSVCLRDNNAIGGVATEVVHSFSETDHTIMASVVWDDPTYRAESGASLHQVADLIFLDDESDIVGQVKETSEAGIVVGQCITHWCGQLCHFMDFVDDNVGLLTSYHPSQIVTEAVDVTEEEEDEDESLEEEDVLGVAPEATMDAYGVAAGMAPEASAPEYAPAETAPLS